MNNKERIYVLVYDLTLKLKFIIYFLKFFSFPNKLDRKLSKMKFK